MTGRHLTVALLILLSTFALVQGLRLAGDEGWSWIYSVGYGIALLLLLFMYWQSRSPHDV